MGVLVATGCHTEGTAHDQREPRHSGLIDSSQSPHAGAHDTIFFGLKADLKARNVDQIHYGKPEQLGQVDQAQKFFSGMAVPTPTIVIGVTCSDNDWPTVHTRQARDDSLAPMFANFEEGAF